MTDRFDDLNSLPAEILGDRETRVPGEHGISFVVRALLRHYVEVHQCAPLNSTVRRQEDLRMANRAYLYSLSNQPTSYADRPDTISGLSEWAYAVPFSYRVLMSGNPQLCASLVSDGFRGEPANQKTKLHAISGDFETGFARLKRFISVVRPLAASYPTLVARFDETLTFLDSHRDRYLLLETVELDTMTTDREAELRACVEREIAECVRVGAAIDALPADVAKAGSILTNAIGSHTGPPLDAFHGLRLDDDFDSVQGGNKKPLGLRWAEVLYFNLRNRVEFGADH